MARTLLSHLGMTTTRTAAAPAPPPGPAAPVSRKPLQPYVTEGSAEAGPLRELLAATGIAVEGRPLDEAVRAFQLRHNASGASPIDVDGKAGEQTLGALQAQLAGADRSVTGDQRGRFSSFLGEGRDYGARDPRSSVSGARVGTAMSTSGGNEATVRRLLEAQLSSPVGAARAATAGVGEGEGSSGGAGGETVRRGARAVGAGTAVPFVAPVGKDALAEALGQARTSGRAQQLDLNGTRVTVHPHETLDAVRHRYASERRAPARFEAPVGKDALREALDQARSSGRAQQLDLDGTRVVARPTDDLDALRRRFSASARSGATTAGPTVDGLGALGKAGSTAARVAGKVAVPLGLALDALDIGSAIARDALRADGTRTETTRAVGRAAGGWGGAAAGAAAGAAIGSVVPVVGTAIGAVVGGLAGGVAGSELGESIAGKR